MWVGQILTVSLQVVRGFPGCGGKRLVPLWISDPKSGQGEGEKFGEASALAEKGAIEKDTPPPPAPWGSPQLTCIDHSTRPCVMGLCILYHINIMSF